MAAKLINPDESIDVQQLCCLLYGQPGARKSSLAQTADEPITLAFDKGIYRAFGRKHAALFDTWADVLSFDLKPYKTVIVDTVGMALEKLAAAIIADNPKNGNRLGGLSLPGYGVLKTQFAGWVSSIRERGQQLVFLAHEKIEKNGDDVYCCPDIVGSNYATLMNHCDIVGYLHFEGGKRVLDFAPTDRWMAKTPPAGWGQLTLPDFGQEPNYLAHLISDARASMGRVSEASAAVAKTVAEWQQKIAAAESEASEENTPAVDAVNKLLPGVTPLQNGTKKQVWHLFTEHAAKHGWTFDKTAKKFVAPAKQEDAA